MLILFILGWVFSVVSTLWDFVPGSRPSWWWRINHVPLGDQVGAGPVTSQAVSYTAAGAQAVSYTGAGAQVDRVRVPGRNVGGVPSVMSVATQLVAYDVEGRDVDGNP